ncbi:unnamed protein product [Polarella glacialis]|uniref:Glutathione peroxidase n=1 Tax=Polarella glacialis TaxID=89957 RepID=A0A813GCY5_POLGL|nr:unnamed protein product [Polarella glacialis]
MSALVVLRCFLAILSIVSSLESMLDLGELVAAAENLTDIDGQLLPTSHIFASGATLITNVADTDLNYRELADLDTALWSQGLRILAFPCNQFGAQEPGASNAEIKEFVRSYDVGFTLMSRIDVNGPSADPLWRLLKERLGGGDVTCNFQTKFLLSCSSNRCRVARFEGKNLSDLRPVIMELESCLELTTWSPETKVEGLPSHSTLQGVIVSATERFPSGGSIARGSLSTIMKTESQRVNSPPGISAQLTQKHLGGHQWGVPPNPGQERLNISAPTAGSAGKPVALNRLALDHARDNSTPSSPRETKEVASTFSPKGVAKMDVGYTSKLATLDDMLEGIAEEMLTDDRVPVAQPEREELPKGESPKRSRTGANSSVADPGTTSPGSAKIGGEAWGGAAALQAAGPGRGPARTGNADVVEELVGGFGDFGAAMEQPRLGGGGMGKGRRRQQTTVLGDDDNELEAPASDPAPNATRSAVGAPGKMTWDLNVEETKERRDGRNGNSGVKKPSSWWPFGAEGPQERKEEKEEVRNFGTQVTAISAFSFD